jgi:hypothetical protein
MALRFGWDLQMAGSCLSPAGQSGNRNLECLYRDGPIAQAARPIDERVSSTQRGTQRNSI